MEGRLWCRRLVVRISLTTLVFKVKKQRHIGHQGKTAWGVGRWTANQVVDSKLLRATVFLTSTTKVVKEISIKNLLHHSRPSILPSYWSWQSLCHILMLPFWCKPAMSSLKKTKNFWMLQYNGFELYIIHPPTNTNAEMLKYLSLGNYSLWYCSALCWF